VATATGVFVLRRVAARSKRLTMAWTTPVVIETPCGAEINLYISAEI
jgi:coenzyme PQQ precursor peptide PqqA